jgi:23S rRNA (pseudouridine1915-N3)-methyltransferase
MTRYLVLAVGRQARDPLLEAADDYLGRLQRFVPTDLQRIKEGGIEREAKGLLDKLPDSGRVVVLDERGAQPTTRELAQKLKGWEHLRQVSFVIGGADGLHDDVKARGHEMLALSRLTLPHRLALVLLLEQLYRAQAILRGTPYHRD